MSWNWVQGGDSLYAALFSLSNCQVRIWPILIIFLKKGHATYITEAEEKTWSQKFILTPWNRVFLKASVTFPELRGTFQNWGPASVMKPPAIAHQLVSKSLIKEEAFPKLKAPLNSGKLAGIRLGSNKGARDEETTRNYFSKIEGRPSILEKWPPWK